MKNFDIERMHRDCLEWCKNPVWKPWQQEYRLEKMTGNYRRILDKHRSLIASLYDDSDLYDGLPTMQFAHLIGLDVESYRKEAAKPEKEIETIEQEAHEILIGKGWVWNESLNRWQKGDARIYHNDGDFYTYKKGDAEKVIASKPWNALLPFDLWADSIESESEKKADQDDPFAELIQNLERLKNGILENDRQDRIELLKLAVQMATEHSKTNTVWDFGAATETFYKQLCKLAGLNEPQPQTVEQALQNLETLMAEPPDASDIATNALTPKEVLAKPAEAAKKVNSQDESISFLRSVITYPEMSDFHQEKGMVYFTWCEARYRFNTESNEVSLMHNGGITDNPSSILMTALVKLAAKA